MDISIITASIGSFVLSERVIKAKAWILAVLGTVVAYDLTQTSEDPWSLRVYRGPALVACTISCVAASLRIWRRSGVACDELLFLPGTPMAALHHPDVKCPEEAPVEGGEGEIARYDGLSTSDVDEDNADGITGMLPTTSDLPPSPIVALEEGKSASSSAGEMELASLQQNETNRGGGGGSAAAAAAHRRSLSPANTNSENANEADAAAGMMNVPQSPQIMRSRRNTGDDQLIRAANNTPSLMAYSHDEEDGHDGQDAFENDKAGGDGGADTGNASGDPSTPLPFRKRILQRAESVTKDESMIRYLLCSQAGESLRRRRGGNVASDAASTPAKSSSDDGTQPAPTGSSSKNVRFKKLLRVARRLGLHQFIRSKPLENEMTYAPSGPSVAGAAVDLCLPVLFNFHMFFLLSRQRAADIAAAMAEAAADASATAAAGDADDDDDDDRVPKDTDAANIAQPDGLNPRVLPLIFLSVLFIRAAFPPKARRRFWGTIKYTICAPFYAVYFRDAFIGDVFTSLVRPIQDLVYCLFYYSVSVWAMFSSTSSLDEAGDILKNSWVLHNFALTACAVLPLWWKFLQTLRQAKDSGQHWPHLGNAFKYLSAALVIFYAMAHPEGRRGKVWIASFLGAVVYQIWWDIWMDWELLEFVPRGSSSLQPTPSEGTRLCNCLTISSIPGSSYLLIPLHQYIVRPFVSALHRVSTFVAGNTISLRSKRLYARDAFYWRVLAYNVCFRFIWMLSFIPAYHFSKSGTEVPTLSIDFRTYVGAFISVAELIRRCLWCVIKLELETIKVTDTERDYEPLMKGVDGTSSRHLNLNTMDEKFGDKQHPMNVMVSALKFESQALMLKGGISPKSMQPGGQGQARRRWCNFSDNFLRKAFIAELIVWVVAFVGLSILCVIR